MTCDPTQWVGLGFVATIENAQAVNMAQIEGISAVAAQVVWGMDEQKPALMQAYLDDLAAHDLLPVGWGWCDAEDAAGVEAEGFAHANVAAKLGLDHFIANMEEPYDAHGDGANPKFHLPAVYCESFRKILPDIHFAVTTTPRWASDHSALRQAGAVLMGQAFPIAAEGGTSVDAVCEFGKSWGWTMDRLRPLCQVYETNGQVPPAKPFLDESAKWNVGLVPYILEQAFGGQGRDLLNALVPAITRQPAPTNGGTVPPTNDIPPVEPGEIIGPDHGITALVNFLQAQPGMPVRDPAKYHPEKPATWPWPERLERALKILAADHDAEASQP